MERIRVSWGSHGLCRYYGMQLLDRTKTVRCPLYESKCKNIS